MSTNLSTPQGQKETLDRILAELRSGDEARCLAAIAELGAINFSSGAIVAQLERLALEENPAIRENALKALDLRTSIFVASKHSSLINTERLTVLKEIGNWERDGLVESHRAEVLRHRYDFDARTGIQARVAPAAEPVVKPAVPSAEPGAPAPAPRPQALPATPRRSLMEVLFNETSIKILLYLGAFFVITAAAIVAYREEAVRLPILIVVTIAFAASAVGLRKRLPQPSFALAIVFSFLLPIDANVVADTLNLSVRANEIYWTILFGIMAIVWALGTWFYESRLFSIAAFFSLALSALRFSEIFEASPARNMFSVVIVNLLGLLAVRFIKRWKEQKFALPLFWLAHVLQVCLLALSFATVFLDQFGYARLTTGEWIATSLMWILAASFYVASDTLIPFLLFPWMAVASLFLLPWFSLSAFRASGPVHVFGFAVWGIVHALTSELVQRSSRPALTKYHYPLLAWSLPLFLVAVARGFTEETAYGFAAFLCASLAYTIVNVMRPRWYVWLTALLAGLGAYFTFFALPFMEKVGVDVTYQFLVASLLLLVPELFFKKKLTFERSWNWPPVLLGVSLTALNLIVTVAASKDDRSAVLFGATAVLSAAYALRFKQPVIGYFAAASTALTVVFTLQYYEREEWLPALTVLSALFYIGGFLLARRETTKPWSAMLVNSGLALGGLISLLAWMASEPAGGWYTLVIAALFVIEMFTRKNGWLEVFAEAVLSIALLLFLDDLNIYQGVYRLFGLSLLWLACDMVFKVAFSARKLEPAAKIMGGMFTVFGAILIGADLPAQAAAICFGIYTLFFAVYAWLHNNPLYGYASTTAFALLVHFGMKTADLQAWIFPQIGVAIFYYVIGFVLRRASQAKGWDRMLLFSGLGLGAWVAVASPFQDGGLEKAIPVAIAATFYAAEAFARRNVWLGFPANALYLASYFVLLNELNVHERQFYSVGAAALGLFQHYLLTRARHKTTAFITGLVSQLVLLGVTYVQMVDTGELNYFFVLFFQALAVLAYGIVIRSRSLVIAPIGFFILAILTILYNSVKDLAPVLIIGITGLIMIGLGILAVVMRERITDMAERFSDWDA